MFYMCKFVYLFFSSWIELVRWTSTNHLITYTWLKILLLFHSEKRIENVTITNYVNAFNLPDDGPNKEAKFPSTRSRISSTRLKTVDATKQISKPDIPAKVSESSVIIFNDFIWATSIDFFVSEKWREWNDVIKLSVPLQWRHFSYINFVVDR